jgi:hypothetical protein
MNRRKFISLVGGGVVLAAGVAAGLRVTRTPDEALLPWKRAGSTYSEPRMRALSYAILAPNPHNRQPWRIDLSAPGEVKLLVDQDRLLPHTDPFNRQITVGLGCFLELLRLAGAADGYRVDLDLFPDGFDETALDARPVAVATFTKDPTVAPDPLFDHVLERRSHKEAFDTGRGVSDQTLAKIQRSALHGTKIGASNNLDHLESVRTLTREAMLIEINTERTYKESVDLLRIGKTEIEANPDGIDLSGPKFETLHLLGMISREGALDTGSAEFEQGKAAVLEPIATAMAHLWLVSDTPDRTAQIRAGQDWLRINLAATRQGVALHPLSQALQEYPEMNGRYDKVHSLFAPDGGTVQMLGRLGYAAPVPASPRWPVESRIIGS